MRYFHSNRAVISLQSCVHFTPIIRSSLFTHAVLYSRHQLFLKFFVAWNSSSRWFETLVSSAWNFWFHCLKPLFPMLETRVSPIWNLCFPRMKLIPCLHPRISLSLSVYFRSYFFPFSRHFPVSVPCLFAVICSPKSDNTLTCFSYCHPVITSIITLLSLLPHW